ncbi:ROK family protein [uncultured Sphaerochaeta sp.]|uniref:ROK family protein n=1 Tax=uncultured Sphaerochaeta sp. TaxID=886478 RepID=UPI002A0A49EA|nr:ROK family protein [uncultured Sphaerochaeta sp.]
MLIEPGNNLPRVKISNQAAIKRIVYLYGPITRLEIAKALNLTLPTITTNINNMIHNEIIQESQTTTTQVKAMGRKSNPVEIIPSSRYFIGVEIKQSYRIAVLTDYKGNIIQSIQDDTDTTNYENIIQSCASLINTMLHTPTVNSEKIFGIGICTPGIIDTQKGILKVQRQFHWKNKNMVEDILRLTKFKGNITLENDAIARATMFNLFNNTLLGDSHIFAYLFVSDGISCPLMMNNPNFVCTSVGPGELGYMIMDPNKPDDEFGSTGKLSSFSGERVIKEQCIKEANTGNIPALKAILDANNKIYMQDILRSQNEGNTAVHEILSKAASYLGIAIANVDNMFRPDCILVEAKLFNNEINKTPFLEALQKNLFGPEEDKANFIFITPENEYGAKGAAAIAIQKDLGTYIG